MIVDCPYCFTPVIPKDDGTCPACQGNTREHGIDANKTSLTISQGTPLPPICAVCGHDTDHLVTVSRSVRDHDASSWLMKMFGGFISLPLSVFLHMRDIQQTSHVRIRLPQCSLCKAAGAPNPRYVDFREARMTFVVHRRLRDAVMAQKAESSMKGCILP